MSLRFNPVVLISMDGFGIAPPDPTNAISQANTPFLDKLCRHFPTMLLEASGLHVGLPRGEMGNSETGHLNIGTGKLVYQSLPRINKSIRDKDFFENDKLLKTIKHVQENGSQLHIMGLLGEGGVHAHQKHMHALVDLCKKNNLKDNVYYHLFLDGRDTERDASIRFLNNFLNYKKEVGNIGKIASMAGRYYGMDRNENWDRIKQSYKAIALGESENQFTDPLQAIKESHNQEVYDEKFEPSVGVDKSEKPLTQVQDGDAIIFFNFRADRARQMTKVFTQQDFDEFERDYKENLEFTTMTEYEKDLPVNVIFPPEIIETPLAKVISDNNLKQLHIAETEKYAHVTFFLNGRIEKAFPGEDRKIIPSPSVSSYDQKPEMSAYKIANEVRNNIEQENYQFYAINFANADMVGHTANLDASIEAVEAVDDCVETITTEAVKRGGAVFITADHGNAENMANLQTGDKDKEHTIYPVPFITVSKYHKDQQVEPAESIELSQFSPRGVLSDVAPTLLAQIGLDPPEEMTGTNLLK